MEDIKPIQPIESLDELDLTNVDANRPLVKESMQEVKLSKLEVKDNTKKTGKILHITISLLNPAPTTNEKGVRAGFTHTEMISLVPTEKYNPQENLARVQLCFLGKQGKWNSVELLGQTGTVKFKITDDDEYGKQNRVTWIPRKEKKSVPTLA